jgi:tetratricopeptide (TPR) repeat protein
MDMNAFLYVTVGGDEQAEVKAATYRMMALLEEKAPEGLDWEYRVMDGHTHGSLLLKSLYDGLEALYHDWPLPDEVARGSLAGLREHYGTLSERYGYTIGIPELVVNGWGYRALQEERYDDAVEAFIMNAELYPESANVYDSLGEALEVIGDLERAQENYKLAVTKGAAIADPNLAFYRDHLRRVQEKLSGTGD